MSSDLMDEILSELHRLNLIKMKNGAYQAKGKNSIVYYKSGKTIQSATYDNKFESQEYDSNFSYKELVTIRDLEIKHKKDLKYVEDFEKRNRKALDTLEKPVTQQKSLLQKLLRKEQQI